MRTAFPVNKSDPNAFGRLPLRRILLTSKQRQDSANHLNELIDFRLRQLLKLPTLD